MLITSMFSFPDVFYPSLNKFQFFLITSILLSANALNLDRTKILSFGKDLKIAKNVQSDLESTLFVKELIIFKK